MPVARGSIFCGAQAARYEIKRKFGVEFEFYVLPAQDRGEDRDDAQRDESQSVAADQLRQKSGLNCRWHARDDNERRGAVPYWKLVDDNSLHGGGPRGLGKVYTGAEVVSPILKGVEGLDQVNRMGLAMEELGAETTKSTGFHVHIDAKDLKSSGAAGLEALKKICVAYIVFEPALDLLTKRDRQDRQNILTRSNQKEMMLVHGGSVKDQLDRIKAAPTIEDLVKLVNPNQRNPDKPSRIYKLNLTNLIDTPNGRGHGTIEFRQHHGTVNAKAAGCWVELLQFFVHRTKKPEANFVDIPSGPDGQPLKASQLWLHMMYKTVDRKHLTIYFWERICELDSVAVGRDRRIHRAPTDERQGVAQIAQRVRDLSQALRISFGQRRWEYQRDPQLAALRLVPPPAPPPPPAGGALAGPPAVPFVPYGADDQHLIDTAYKAGLDEARLEHHTIRGLQTAQPHTSDGLSVRRVAV